MTGKDTFYELMKVNYNKEANQVIQAKSHNIHVFDIAGSNIDEKVVEEFGEEWLKFNDFPDDILHTAVEEYFDILDEKIINKGTYAIDIGCGTGRWSKFLSSKVEFIEAVDPSNAIYAAEKLLADIPNVRLTRASVNTLPFNDETFDFAMSIGVLHHIPDTQQAMTDCVKKVKKGGYFYTYLYYSVEDRGFLFKTLFKISDFLRSGISKMSSKPKKVLCDIIAVVVYMPFVLLTRFLRFIGLKKFAMKLPLSYYYNKSFFIIRNDALDRFGTRLEQRFTKSQIEEMMRNAGLTDIVFSDGVPYWHAVGKRHK